MHVFPATSYSFTRCENNKSIVIVLNVNFAHYYCDQNKCLLSIECVLMQIHMNLCKLVSVTSIMLQRDEWISNCSSDVWNNTQTSLGSSRCECIGKFIIHLGRRVVVRSAVRKAIDGDSFRIVDSRDLWSPVRDSTSADIVNPRAHFWTYQRADEIYLSSVHRIRAQTRRDAFNQILSTFSTLLRLYRKYIFLLNLISVLVGHRNLLSSHINAKSIR